MNERPIIFSGPMVQAILDGRKTQTRRIMKPKDAYPECIWCRGQGYEYIEAEYGLSGYDYRYPCRCRARKCPYGQPRDLLYVRETWGIQGSTCIGKGTQREFFNAPQLKKYSTDYWKTVIQYKASGDPCIKWWPSIHMPKAYARLWLRITNVRVDKLVTIDYNDAIKEGFDSIDSFKEYWDQLNQKRSYSWEQNPWLWVLDFEKIQK